MKISFNSLLRQSFLLLLLALPVGILTGLLHPRAPTWTEDTLKPGEVHLETVLSWDEVIWLDARSRKEFEEDHIPGAQLLNEDEWDDLFFEFMETWDPDRNIVVYCGSTQCQASTHVAERLRTDLGTEEIYVLKGGWGAWSQQK